MSRTRILLASVILWLPLLAGGVYFFPRTSCGTPSATQTARCVAEPIQDLGHTSVQKEWAVVFPVRNDGARRLVLNELEPGCCGDRVRRTILVPPGATAKVTVTLDTRRISGPIESTVAFATSDPAHPFLNLTARAWVDVADVMGHSDTPNSHGAAPNFLRSPIVD